MVAALLITTTLILDAISRRALRGGAQLQMYGSAMTISLCIVLLGPLPAAAIAVATIVADDVSYGRRDHLVGDVAVYGAVTLVAGFAAQSWIAPLQGFEFATAVAVLTLTYDAAVTVLGVTVHDHTMLRRVGATYVRILPWIAAASILVAAAAEGYRDGGGGVLALCMLGLVACEVLLVRLDAVEVRLRAERDRSATYLQMVGTMVVSLDGHERVVFMNDRARLVLGDVTGRPWDAIDSGERIVDWTRTQLADGTVLLSGEDVTERHEREEQMARLAFLDALTGLENRAVLDRELPNLLVYAGSAALLLIDIDDFKRVNDAHGHAVGDRVLAEAAARLRAVADPDALLIRRGGDEFVLLIPELAADDECAARRAAAATAERLVRAFDAPFPVAGRIDVSVATALYPFDGADLEHVANAAMHGLKQRTLI